MNVYSARNNVQVEFIRFRKKYRLYSGFLFRIEEFNPISLTECNSRPDRVYYNIIVIQLDSCHRLDTIGIRTFARCDFRHSIASLSLVAQLYKWY